MTKSPSQVESDRRRQKARQRALNALAKQHPDEFDDLLTEELKVVGVRKNRARRAT